MTREATEENEMSAGMTPPAINLNVTLTKGNAIVPAWVLVLFSALFVVSTFGLIVTLFVETQMVKEVRVMQMYQEDFENILIRANLANRSDFAYHPH